MIIMIIYMAFAWAIGGEKYFGKYKRGFLLLPGFLAFGIALHAPWYYYPVQIAITWPIYQVLFYDPCINAAYGVGTPLLLKIAGQLGIWFNGVLCGLQVALLCLSLNYSVMAIALPIVAGLGFVLICYISNVLKWFIPICWKPYGVGIFCPADGWWLACFTYGGILGVLCSTLFLL